MNSNFFRHLLNRSQIIRMPEKNIDTFDKSCFKYSYLSPVNKLTTRHREGRIVIHKPLILLPENTTNLMHGFDRELSRMAEQILFRGVGEIRSLGYQFMHIQKGSRIEVEPMHAVTVRLLKEGKDCRERVIVLGDELFWEACLLKFVFKIIERSFSTNFGELEERGLLDPRGLPPSTYEHIEKLFKDAKTSKATIKELGAFLLEKGLFEDYEDRFFNLMKRR